MNGLTAPRDRTSTAPPPGALSAPMRSLWHMVQVGWNNLMNLPSVAFRCGHCGEQMATDKGWTSSAPSLARIYVCSHCTAPTFLTEDAQYPGTPYAGKVAALPPHVDALYEEARRAMSINAYTAAVMAARKVLMNVAVAQGATEGQRFAAYVDWLADQGYVPPGGKGWVDRIRDKGNEANHEIRLMERHEAEEVLSFLEMLLKFVYEFPAKASAPSSRASDASAG